jgi:hypothetical protein
MKKAFGILMVIAAMAGFAFTGIGADLKHHFMARRGGIEAQAAECPNARHFYGI